MSQHDKVYDTTIIGAGPVGMFTAFYAGLRNMSVKIIESLPHIGGQLSALYPEKYIYDIPGSSKIKAQDLVNQLEEQMNQFEPTVVLNEAVQEVTKLDDGTFHIVTNENEHYTKTIIITAGNGAFKPRKLNLPKEDQFEGKNIHYFVDDMNKFSGKKVTIFGGGDSAVDWALMLEQIAEEVTIIHRRDQFRAHESTVNQMLASKVNVLTPYVPVDLIGNESIEKIKLQQPKFDIDMTIAVEEVIVNYGFVSNLGPIKDWGLDITKNSIEVNSKMETNLQGIYAVGDINTYDGKVKLIATGFGEAPIAVSNAKVYIDPTARVQPIHSTSVMGEKSPKKDKVKSKV